MISEQAFITLFLDGKFQKHYLAIIKTLTDFTEHTRVELVRIQRLINSYNESKVGSLTTDLAQGLIRTDLESARSFLIRYRVVLSSMENRLAIISSRFGLRDFLVMNGIPEEDLGFVNSVLASYWEQTYGEERERLVALSNALREMHERLQQQIVLLEGLGSASYFEGFTLNAEIRSNFAEEYKAFRRLDKGLSQLKGSKKRIRSEFDYAKKQARAALRILLNERKERFGSAIATHNDGACRAALALGFVGGALVTFLKAESDILKAASKNLFTAVSQVARKREIARIEKLLGALANGYQLMRPAKGAGALTPAFARTLEHVFGEL